MLASSSFAMSCSLLLYRLPLSLEWSASLCVLRLDLHRSLGGQRPVMSLIDLYWPWNSQHSQDLLGSASTGPGMVSISFASAGRPPWIGLYRPWSPAVSLGLLRWASTGPYLQQHLWRPLWFVPQTLQPVGQFLNFLMFPPVFFNLFHIVVPL